MREVIDAQRRERIRLRLASLRQQAATAWRTKGVLPDDESEWPIVQAGAARGDAWVVGKDSPASFGAGDVVVFDGVAWVNCGPGYVSDRDLAMPAQEFTDVPASSLRLLPSAPSLSCMSVDVMGGIVPCRLLAGDQTEVDASSNAILNRSSSTGGAAHYPVLDPPFASQQLLPALAVRNGFGFVEFVREDGAWVWMAVGGFTSIRKLFNQDLPNRLGGDILSDCIVSLDKGASWTQQNAAVLQPPSSPPEFQGLSHPLLMHYRDSTVPGSPDIVYMVGGICSLEGQPLTRVGANHIYRSQDAGVTWELTRPNDPLSSVVRNFGAAGLVGASGSVSGGTIWLHGGAVTSGSDASSTPTAETFVISTTTPRALRYSTDNGVLFTSTLDLPSTAMWTSGAAPPFLSPTSFFNPSYAYGHTRVPSVAAPNRFLVVGGLVDSLTSVQGVTRSATYLVNPDNQAPLASPPTDPYTLITISNQFDNITHRPPASRVQPQLAFDVSFNTVVLFGGSRVSSGNTYETIFLADADAFEGDRLAWREQFGMTNDQGMNVGLARIREGALACRGDGKVYLIAGSVSTLEKNQREVRQDGFELDDLQNDRVLEFSLRTAVRMVTLGPNVETTNLEDNGLRNTVVLDPPRPPLTQAPRLMGASKHTEYVPGNGPLILCSLLGGHVFDPSITPLQGGAGEGVPTHTNQAALDLATRIELALGFKPHIVMVHLSPTQVDASAFIWRRLASSPFASVAANDQRASRAWFETHEWVAMAREKVVESHGRGLMLELVGTAGSQVEIGYLLPIASSPLAPEADHSARRLQDLKAVDTESFIRGGASLGRAIQDRLPGSPYLAALEVTPSPDHPTPDSMQYGPGGDFVAAYGSATEATPAQWVRSDAIDAIRISIPTVTVLSHDVSRIAFNKVLADALSSWVQGAVP